MYGNDTGPDSSLGGSGGTGTLGAIINGVTNLTSSMINANQAKKSREAQRKLAEYSYSKDTEAWNNANFYNSPAEQMKRLKEAGLNPNLMYGSSSGTGNTSTQTPKYQAYDPKYHQWDFNAPDMLEILNSYQDYQNKKVVHDNLGKQTELMAKESNLKSLNMAKTAAQTAKTKSERDKIEQFKSTQYDLLQNQAKHERLRMNITSKDWQNYNQFGVRPSDSLLYRGGAELLKKIKSSPNNLILKKGWEKLKNSFKN